MICERMNRQNADVLRLNLGRELGFYLKYDAGKTIFASLNGLYNFEKTFMVISFDNSPVRSGSPVEPFTVYCKTQSQIYRNSHI